MGRRDRGVTMRRGLGPRGEVVVVGGGVVRGVSTRINMLIFIIMITTIPQAQ